MIRDSDDAFDGVDKGEADSSAVPTESSRRDTPSYRPFTAWPTARENSEESFWARTRERFARMFRRASDNSNNGDGANADGANADGANAADAATASQPASPPEDFQFPWTRDEDFSAPAADASTDRQPSDADLPLLEPFGTVDEALPVAGATPNGDSTASLQGISEADTDPTMEAATEPTDTQEVPAPTGLLARLFRRNSESTTTELEAVTAEEEKPTFLVTKFRAFYNEVLHQKHHGSDITAGFATAILTQDEASGESPEQAAQALSARLQQMLELQQAEATWTGGETAARFHDAQYAMAVLADETLSTVEWKGMSAWPKVSLEQKLFKSSAGDLEFFKRVDRLFKEGASTGSSRDLARVYLLTIAAGFRGKYGAFGLTRPLHEYRQRLYEYIHGGDALLLYADDRSIFPEAKARTLPGKATARVSSAQRWVAVLIFILLAYTVLAHIAWNRASSDLRDVTGRVEATKQTGAR